MTINFLSIIVLTIGFALALTRMFKAWFGIYKAVAEIKIAYRKHGKEWNYWSNPGRRIGFLLDKNTIFSGDDDPSIKAAKEVLVNRRNETLKALPGVILVAFVTAVLAFILQIIFLSLPANH
jgi:hypothetical protein